MQTADSFEKTLMLGKIEGRRRGWQDEMLGWHHHLDGHEFEQAPRVGDGQGSLACCSPWGCKWPYMTELLTELNWMNKKEINKQTKRIYWTVISTVNKINSALRSVQVVSSVQSLSCVWLFETLWSAAHQASLSITNSRNFLKLMSIESVMPSNHLILCCPLLLLTSIFLSIRVFSNE